MDIWNEKDLKPPPIITYKALTNNIDLPLLHKILNDAVNYLKDNNFLRYEIQLIEKSMNSLTKRFRNHKDCKSLLKLRKAVRNLFEMNLPECLSNFKLLLPKNYRVNDTYLPTKNNLEYVLVRLQGAGKLCVRIFETCKITASLLYTKVCIGQYWGLCMIYYAIVSRIFVIIKHMIKCLAELYGKLLLFSTKLQNTNTLWLPKDYKFPKDLLVWLDIQDLESEENVIEIVDETPDLIKYFNLMDNQDSDNEDVEFCGEYIMVNEDSDEEKGTQKPSTSSSTRQVLPEPQMETIDLRGFDLDEDIGEVIQIDESLDDNVMIVDDVQVTKPKNQTKKRIRKIKQKGKRKMSKLKKIK